ncbi:hypothetical protein D3C81_2299760 [compost metagenome]
MHVRNNRIVGGVMVNQARDRRPLESLVERSQEANKAQLADVAISLKTVAA